MGDHGGMTVAPGAILRAVPLFPLPNVVLFPRAILPLHIFEERYKTMTADALAGDRQIAMALLKPGWEKNYYGRPEIEPVVCVGTILTHERLADGKYNFLLEGRGRARIVRETGGGNESVYRRGDLQILLEVPMMEIDLGNERARLVSLLREEGISEISLARQFVEMLGSPLNTADIADLIAFNLVEDVRLKQELLAEVDPRRRVSRVIEALQGLRPLGMARGSSDPSLN